MLSPFITQLQTRTNIVNDLQEFMTLQDLSLLLQNSFSEDEEFGIGVSLLETTIKTLGEGYLIKKSHTTETSEENLSQELQISVYMLFKIIFHLGDRFKCCRNLAWEIITHAIGLDESPDVNFFRSTADTCSKELSDQKELVVKKERDDSISSEIAMTDTNRRFVAAEDNRDDFYETNDDYLDNENSLEVKRKKRSPWKKVRKKKTTRVKLNNQIKEVEHPTDVSSNEEEYSCSRCEKVFPTKKTLNHHKIRKHKMYTDFSCKVCGKKFRDNYKLKRHSNVHRLKETKKPCPLCGKSFQDNYKLNRHIEQHNTEYNFKCPVCSKAFTTERYLKRHELTHSTERPFQCYKCGDVYKDRRSFHLHMARDHGDILGGLKTYQCPECSRFFRNTTDLENHISTKHRGEKRNICDICGKSFGLKSHLKGHLKTVHFIGVTESTKIYPCNFCDKKFMYKTSFEAHTSTHTGEKPYACNICHRKFSTMGNLGSHVKNIHNLPFTKKSYEEQQLNTGQTKFKQSEIEITPGETLMVLSDPTSIVLAQNNQSNISSVSHDQTSLSHDQATMSHEQLMTSPLSSPEHAHHKPQQVSTSNSPASTVITRQPEHDQSDTQLQQQRVYAPPQFFIAGSDVQMATFPYSFTNNVNNSLTASMFGNH